MPAETKVQVGLAAEAFQVSHTPPLTCRMCSRLFGSISTSSTQPDQPSKVPLCGAIAEISRQLAPASSDSCTTGWPSQLPQELVTPSAMRVVAPVPDTDRPPMPKLTHCSGSYFFSRVQLLPSNLYSLDAPPAPGPVSCVKAT